MMGDGRSQMLQLVPAASEGISGDHGKHNYTKYNCQLYKLIVFDK